MCVIITGVKVPVPAARGALTTLVKRPAAASSREGCMSSESLSFGKLRPVYAAKKSYIQYADGDSGKWLLLVNVEASATTHHKELCKMIFEWVVENPCTKENVVGWKLSSFENFVGVLDPVKGRAKASSECLTI